MRRSNELQPDDDHPDDGLSKTEVKKALLELQDLGLALIELPEAELEALELDDRLREALADLRRIQSHGARRRQIQFVGKLLRHADAEPLRRALASSRASRLADAHALHEIERWRDRLIAGDEAWSAWVQAHPQGDTRQLRALVQDARRELERGAKGRAFRELFRQLRAVLLASARAP